MKIVLLNSSFVSQMRDFVQRTKPAARTGIASMAGYLRAAGHEVRVLDPQPGSWDAAHTADRILDAHPDYVGLTAYTEEIHDAAEIARAVKQRAPNVTTIIGGYHFAAIPEETLAEFESFDLGVLGEGELPLAEILEGRPLESVPGAVFRRDGRVVINPARTEWPSLDTYPDPAWDLYPDLNEYRAWIPVEAVRSCPFQCSFCFKTLTNRVRYKSPGRILEELRKNVTDYDMHSFSLASGGTFPLLRSHAVELLELIMREGLQIRWWTASRVDYLDEELLALMKRAGCYHLNLGVESGDPDLLERCHKGFTLDQVEQAVRWCYRLGIETDLNFIVGLPYETRESLRNTRRFVARIRNISTIAGFSILTPYPGTEVYEMALRNEGGLRLNTRDWRKYSKFQGEAIIHENFAPGELRKHQVRLFLSYYFGSPRKILSVLRSPAGRELLAFRRALELVKRLL